MKKLSVFIGLFVFNMALFAQIVKESQFDKFANQTGTLISKEYTELGYMDQIDVRLVKMKNMFTNESYTGMRFEYMPGNEIISGAKIATIDFDEMQGLIKAIKILQTSVLGKKYKYQSDFTFHCRSGMIIGYFYDADRNKWQPFVQIAEKDPQSTIRMEDDQFSYFLGLLETATSQK